MIEIEYASEKRIPSFHAALGKVASERIYIEMIQPPPIESVEVFQKKLIRKNFPSYYVVDGEDVVGWADISCSENPRLAHRGSLGMGLIPSHRGQGLGERVLNAALGHSQEIGLEKVELTVYVDNKAAVSLYRKLGFVQEGLIPHYRKLDGRYFDCLLMAKFLSELNL